MNRSRFGRPMGVWVSSALMLFYPLYASGDFLWVLRGPSEDMGIWYYWFEVWTFVILVGWAFSATLLLARAKSVIPVLCLTFVLLAGQTARPWFFPGPGRTFYGLLTLIDTFIPVVVTMAVGIYVVRLRRAGFFDSPPNDHYDG